MSIWFNVIILVLFSIFPVALFFMTDFRKAEGKGLKIRLSLLQAIIIFFGACLELGMIVSFLTSANPLEFGLPQLIFVCPISTYVFVIMAGSLTR